MNVTPHDFTKPTRLSVDWHQRLSAWGKVALGLANKSWAKQLPTPLEAALGDLELCYAKPTMSRLSDDMLAYRIKLGDAVICILILPRTLMLNLVGLMMGDNAAVSDRELTLIEEKLGDYFLVNHWLNYFRESWPGPAGVAWSLDGREGNLPCSRIYADTEVILAVHWQMRGAWGDSKGIWYFPKKALLDLLGNESAAAAAAVPEAVNVIRREAIVHNLALSVEVVLGSAELRLSELSSLQVGDVVLLDQRAADGALARAGGQNLFRGQPGKVGSWKAFQIETAVKK